MNILEEQFPQGALHPINDQDRRRLIDATKQFADNEFLTEFGSDGLRLRLLDAQAEGVFWRQQYVGVSDVVCETDSGIGSYNSLNGGRGTCDEGYFRLQIDQTMEEARCRQGDFLQKVMQGYLPGGGCSHKYQIGSDIVLNSSCPKCGGAGQEKCPDCRGEGSVACSNYRCLNGKMSCPTCNGTGHVIKNCSSCGGNGGVYDVGGGYNYNGQPGYKQCPICHGTGTEEVSCDRCYGTSWVDCDKCHGTGRVECQTCKGDKYIPCQACQGTGMVHDIASVYVQISLHVSSSLSGPHLQQLDAAFGRQYRRVQDDPAVYENSAHVCALKMEYNGTVFPVFGYSKDGQAYFPPGRVHAAVVENKRERLAKATSADEANAIFRQESAIREKIENGTAGAAEQHYLDTVVDKNVGNVFSLFLVPFLVFCASWLLLCAREPGGGLGPNAACMLASSLLAALCVPAPLFICQYISTDYAVIHAVISRYRAKAYSLFAVMALAVLGWRLFRIDLLKLQMYEGSLSWLVGEASSQILKVLLVLLPAFLLAKRLSAAFRRWRARKAARAAGKKS